MKRTKPAHARSSSDLRPVERRFDTRRSRDTHPLTTVALFLTIVLDGVGIGAQPDSDQYGDEDSHTLGHVCAVAKPDLPNLAAAGLGCIEPLEGVPCAESPTAAYGKMQEVSAGKDSTTGHWELAGLRLDRAFPVYPDGFPDTVTQKFVRRTGSGGILGNRAASGTQIIDELGDEHVRTGFPIIYTSADSVFQIAAHTDIIPLKTLYRLCHIARSEVLVDSHSVGRVIARPFTGTSGNYERLSGDRKDFSLLPPAETLQQVLQTRKVETVSIGKVYSLFGGVGFDRSRETASNAEGIEVLMEELEAYDGRNIFLWANLVDFDQNFGHRNDPHGFAGALEEFDRALPRLRALIPDDGRLLITADHGTDPTTPGTDHTREYVPVLLFGDGKPRDIGTRASFNDHAATVAEFFDVSLGRTGKSFLI